MKKKKPDKKEMVAYFGFDRMPLSETIAVDVVMVGSEKEKAGSEEVTTVEAADKGKSGQPVQTSMEVKPDESTRKPAMVAKYQTGVCSKTCI